MAATEIVARPDVAAGRAEVGVGEPRFADVAPQSCQRAGADEVLDLVCMLKLDSDGLNAAEGRRRGATHLLRYLSGFGGGHLAAAVGVERHRGRWRRLPDGGL